MQRRKSAIFFLILGISLSTLAVALNVGWIILNLRQVVMLILGIIFFALIITGLILNTIFLIREIRRSEQHDAFLNAVTHELKTPIASIRLYLETLRSREVEPERRAEFYDIMLKDSDRLLNTVEQVLEASRARSRGEFTANERIDISVPIREAAEVITKRYALDEGDIRITRPAEPLFISGDPAEIETVFLNLLDNAVKYSPDERRIAVRIRPSAGGKKVDVFVRDQGIGLDASEFKRIFRRFYRVSDERARAIKGTGLGLYLVRSIVKKHGGRIRAQSKGEGRGTTILVRFPAAETK
ncbi:MAG TPA: two-component sensor histidine kinase [Blastocatellia bacterium]|nr:two-component sensor histidine kinase [Blastocatellia bacterium]